ncbi:uncharacterized protein BYT42DRAFT_570279 [Radiomyces spectabilis]|uniref:uncharacterized protein n=1 Tax=Radiomyces spectabilis TaxID=64574 RepID=UPI0022200F9D|nr:uncharacterized protein BYT42DRAFT_570279 [Radiomyces spectabilis]KAI8377417.1 hypothetical protein BYT42DRAFT_570279 [Radiomyces spectabilis]
MACSQNDVENLLAKLQLMHQRTSYEMTHGVDQLWKTLISALTTVLTLIPHVLHSTTFTSTTSSQLVTILSASALLSSVIRGLIATPSTDAFLVTDNLDSIESSQDSQSTLYQNCIFTIEKETNAILIQVQRIRSLLKYHQTDTWINHDEATIRQAHWSSLFMHARHLVDALLQFALTTLEKSSASSSDSTLLLDSQTPDSATNMSLLVPEPLARRSMSASRKSAEEIFVHQMNRTASDSMGSSMFAWQQRPAQSVETPNLPTKPDSMGKRFMRTITLLKSKPSFSMAQFLSHHRHTDDHKQSPSHQLPPPPQQHPCGRYSQDSDYSTTWNEFNNEVVSSSLSAISSTSTKSAKSAKSSQSSNTLKNIFGSRKDHYGSKAAAGLGLHSGIRSNGHPVGAGAGDAATPYRGLKDLFVVMQPSHKAVASTPLDSLSGNFYRTSGFQETLLDTPVHPSYTTSQLPVPQSNIINRADHPYEVVPSFTMRKGPPSSAVQTLRSPFGKQTRIHMIDSTRNDMTIADAIHPHAPSPYQRHSMTVHYYDDPHFFQYDDLPSPPPSAPPTKLTVDDFTHYDTFDHASKAAVADQVDPEEDNEDNHSETNDHNFSEALSSSDSSYFSARSFSSQATLHSLLVGTSETTVIQASSPASPERPADPPMDGYSSKIILRKAGRPASPLTSPQSNQLTEELPAPPASSISSSALPPINTNTTIVSANKITPSHPSNHPPPSPVPDTKEHERFQRPPTRYLKDAPPSLPGRKASSIMQKMITKEDHGSPFTVRRPSVPIEKSAAWVNPPHIPPRTSSMPSFHTAAKESSYRYKRETKRMAMKRSDAKQSLVSIMSSKRSEEIHPLANLHLQGFSNQYKRTRKGKGNLLHVSENGEDVLLMEMGSSKLFVVAGTSAKLLAKLADETAEDLDYIDTFLLNHHFFMPSTQLINDLVARFHLQPVPGEIEYYRKWQRCIQVK